MTTSKASFYSERLHFYTPTDNDRAPLLAVLEMLQPPTFGWDEAALDRDVLGCDPAQGRHAWVLRRMDEVVGAMVARRDALGLEVAVLIAPRWQGLHLGGEVLGRLAVRAFGYDDDTPVPSSALHATIDVANHRALRVAMRLGCRIEPAGDRRVRATLTPTEWTALERGPGWNDQRVARMLDSALPGDAARIAKWLAKYAEDHRARAASQRAQPPRSVPTATGDATLDRLLASPPTRVATPAHVEDARGYVTFGGQLEELQRRFAVAYFSDDDLALLSIDLRRGVSAGGELWNAQNAIEWIRRYRQLRLPR